MSRRERGRSRLQRSRVCGGVGEGRSGCPGQVVPYLLQARGLSGGLDDAPAPLRACRDVMRGRVVWIQEFCAGEKRPRLEKLAAPTEFFMSFNSMSLKPLITCSWALLLATSSLGCSMKRMRNWRKSALLARINEEFHASTITRPMAPASSRGSEGNPAEVVEMLPTIDEATRQPFDLEQVKAILKAAKDDWRGAIMVALYTGARLQDVTDMRWESVDLQNKWIALRASKTRQRIKIPMHDSLHDFLLELPASDSGKAFLFPTLAGKRTGGKSGLSMAFKRIMERAKVRGEVVHERAGEAGRTVHTLSFHSFRHTLTSIMANAGVPVEVRQKFTGHASAEMNAHYTHHEIETLRSAIGKLPAVRP